VSAALVAATRRLGPDAVAVSAIGFGCMPLSLGRRPSEAVALNVLHAALDAGVTLLDTADAYCLDERYELGHNERLVAKALRTWGGPSSEVVVATKAGMRRLGGSFEPDGRPEHLRQACDRSLRALGVDQIGLYQLHTPDPRVPFTESVGALERLREAGKIRWVGLSNVDIDQITAARAIVPVASVQNELSPFKRDELANGVVAHCAGAGLGFLAYSPVGGGLNTRLREHPVLREIAAERGVSVYAVVLAWLVAQAPNIIPIPAARSVEHALDSVRAADLALSAAEVEAIDRATFALPLRRVLRTHLANQPWLKAAFRWARGTLPEERRFGERRYASSTLVTERRSGRDRRAVVRGKLG
jgi:aryl-alcohol dehydrogenase-like predicted oxidoreductase